jgi:1-deoxy-D-xylulose-5-phosphate reductoisomerase
MKKVTLLGSTGSIGRQALEVVRDSGGRLSACALAARDDVEGVLSQAIEFRPDAVALVDAGAAAKLKRELREKLGTEAPAVLEGEAGVVELAADGRSDVVLNAIVGSAGLLPSLAALDAGIRLALANKESLVMAGPLVMSKARPEGALTPVDSEHSSLFRCSRGAGPELRSVTLTASGGAFWGLSLEQMERVTPEQALRHPVWNMGKRITVDSATMMNKALEVIEAQHLFGLEASSVRVAVHPQAYVHGLVELSDGTLLAHMGPPDMKIPIAYALYYPEPATAGVETINLAELDSFVFEKPDYDRFPCLRLGYVAAERGGTAPAALNAADEVAVEAFLEGRIRFTDIAAVVGRVLDDHRAEPLESADQVLEVDGWARGLAGSLAAGK